MRVAAGRLVCRAGGGLGLVEEAGQPVRVEQQLLAAKVVHAALHLVAAPHNLQVKLQMKAII